MYFFGLLKTFLSLSLKFSLFSVRECSNGVCAVPGVSDCGFVKCLCASNRWELLWHFCREFQLESELQAARLTEAEEGWKKKEEEVVEEGWKKRER